MSVNYIIGGGNSKDRSSLNLLRSWSDYDSSKANRAITAELSKDIYDKTNDNILRLSSLEENSIQNISVEGTGNALTSISKEGNLLLFKKETSFPILGETEFTAYRGDRGKIAYDHSQLKHQVILNGYGFVKVNGEAIEYDNNDYSLSSHNHDSIYEPVFTKNTAFNKNFGTTADTVSEGNHTHDYAAINHSHLISDISDLQSILDETLTVISISGNGNAISSVSKSGNTLSFLKGSFAELDENNKIISSQLPSYVDDILEYSTLLNFPQVGESGKIYVSIDTNLAYRWSGTTYTIISPSLALGETSSTAYRGDRGKTAYDHSQSEHQTIINGTGFVKATGKVLSYDNNSYSLSSHNHNGIYEPANSNIQNHIASQSNPHNVTKDQIGLSNVDNTSDSNKPISTAVQNALDLKANTDHTHSEYLTSFTESDPTVPEHVKAITTQDIENWNTNQHTHNNKSTIDSITESHLEILNKFSIVGGKLQISIDTYSTGELSAYGLGGGSEPSNGALSTLVDVQLTNPVDGQYLRYNGTHWINTNFPNITSDWSEITNKPTTLSGYGIEDAYSKTAIDNALLLKLDKAVFDDLFEKVEVSAGVFAIKAKYNFYGVGEVSAYGLGNSSGGGTGASSLSELVDVSLTSLLPNQILRYNGTHWVNENLDIVTTWDELLGKPTTFPASPHIHSISEITGLQNSLDSKASATTLTNHIEDSDIHITSDERTNWDSAYTNTHTHPNKDTIDSLTPAHLEVLSILSLVEGKLRIDADAYSTGELSAYGAGTGSGGGSSYNRLDAWADYSADKSGWVLSALLGNDLNTRLSSVEQGSAMNVAVTGSGNAVTSISKSGTTITATKDSTFSLDGHTHTFASLTSKPTTLAGYGITDGITGTGTANYLPKFTGASSIGNSVIYESGGKIGIGTTSPSSKLSISGVANGTSALVSIVNSGTGRGLFINATNSTNVGFIVQTALSTNLETGRVFSGLIAGDYYARFMFYSDGKYGIGSGNADRDIFIDRSSANTLRVSSNAGTGLGNLVVTGKVGIGTTSPSYTLDVNGTGRFTDTVTAPTFIGALTGNASSATKLQTARTIAGVSFDGTANIDIPFANLASKPTTLGGYGITDAYTKTEVNSALALKLDKSVFDDLFEKVEVSTGVYAIKAKYDFYSVGEVSAYGAGTGGGGTSFNRLDSWSDYTSDKSGWVLSAFLGNDLNTRVGNLEGGSALTVNTTGTGNAITAISKSGNTITATKDLTFSLDGHTHTKSQITDFPTSMPASDVYAWAKAETKPSYTYTEVGAAAASHTHPTVTTSVDGLMSAADKTKLDGISAGARPGTVTSVGLSVPTGLSVTGSPITTSGTFAIALASGYSIPTTAKQTQWDTAYTHSQSAHQSIINGTGFVKASGTTISFDNSTYSPMLTSTATVPAAAGWYRIASSPLDIVRCSGRFEIDWSVSSYHGQITLNAGIMYGTDPTLNVIHYSHFGVGYTKVRIVYHTTYTGNYAYLEIYKSHATATSTTVQLFSPIGWTLITPSTVGSIPTGYTSQELAFYDGIVTEGQLVSTIATGTAPLVVSSTTAVANLNADLLDGLHSSSFATSGHTHAVLTRGSYLTGSNYNGSTATTWAVDATSANTASKVVARDASGNFSAGTITAALSGNAASATKLQTARTIAGVSFNGTANIAIPFANLASKPTTLAGYGITDSFRQLRTVTDLDAVTISGIYRQETPSSGFNYTTTLNLNSIDGRQQLTISRNGSGMKFRGVNSGSETTGWTAWKEVYHTGNLSPVTTNTTQTITGAKTFSTLLTASAGVNAPKVNFGNGFTIEPSGTELVFKYNGVVKQRMLSDGSIVATGEVTAYS